MWLSAVKLLGRYQGKNGQIEIVECSWDGTRVYFEAGREAKPGDARRRKRVHLCQADGRTAVPLATYPGAGLRRRQSRDEAVASRQEFYRRRHQPDQLLAGTPI